MSINLLPADLLPKAAILKVAGILKNVSFAGYALFMIFSLGVGAMILLNSVSVNQNQKRIESLKVEVKSLEQSEQKLLLVKDRLDKTKQIVNSEKVMPQVEATQKLFETTQLYGTLRDALINAKEIDTSFIIGNSANLVGFLSEITKNNIFKTVELKTFSYSPGSGYMLNLIFSN